MFGNKEDDLKIIKKKYGEDMMHFCRSMLATILETPGALSNIMLTHFEPSKSLFGELQYQNKLDNFINFVNSKYKQNDEKRFDKVEDPVALMKKAGYSLYKCNTEEEIQSFKKYYAPQEVICTIKEGNRLDRCHVFFAVRNDANSLLREEFFKPTRQDQYGTSVISIQFSKDDAHILSIKNRYNHSVTNPDATFSNNLDNIIEGLTQSFEDYYGLRENIAKSNLKINGYVLTNKEKLIKYNNKIIKDNKEIYFCPGNIIIDDGEEIRFDSEKYLIIDNFMLDLVNKKVLLYKNIGNTDGFLNGLENIDKIKINALKDTKDIIISTTDKNKITIKVDKHNRIYYYENNNLLKLEHFLENNKSLKYLKVPNLKAIGDYALINKTYLEDFSVPYGIKKIGSHAFEESGLAKINIPDTVEEIGEYAFRNNNIYDVIIPDSLRIIGKGAFEANFLTKLKLSRNIEYIGDYAFKGNHIKNVEIPVNTRYGHSFDNDCKIIKKMEDNYEKGRSR